MMESPKVPPQVYSFSQMVAATNKFHPEFVVGRGGFGKVYKACIPGENQDVAVKKLVRSLGQQGNREFVREVLLLSLFHHPNLVNLIGYCAEGDQRILVYEYMANGALEDHLVGLSADKEPLDWQTRMKIAYGAAKGLEYLHDTASPPIIYRDFKPCNILLDENFNPKLSDFGLARLGPRGDEDYVYTMPMGTYGYCAPEYAMTGKLTKMSDVYCFGVVLLQIISGRRAIDTSKPAFERENVVTWAKPLFKDRNMFSQMADPLLEGKIPPNALHEALTLTAMCLHEEAIERPPISDVVRSLEYLSRPMDDIGRLNVIPKVEKDDDKDDGDKTQDVKEDSAEGQQSKIVNLLD